MKIQLLFALVGLAISFAMPALAQQTNKPDPQLRETIIAVIKKHTDALDKIDAAAVAATSGKTRLMWSKMDRLSVERLFRNFWQTGSNVQFSNNRVTVDEDSPHILGTDGKRCGRPEHGVRPLKARMGVQKTSRAIGLIREGDDWKIRNLTSNVTPEPAK